jgi:hypothetical protein
MQQQIVTVSSNNGSSKLHERYLKYRHYYAGIDISGFGGYGRAVYAPLLPVFDRWFERKSLDDIPHIMPLLEDKTFLQDHPDFRRERGGAISFHIKVLALSMKGLILDEHKDEISRSLLNNVVIDVSKKTKSYDYSECLCFTITVRMFIDMLKGNFSHFGSPVKDLSLHDFANEDTLNPKPQHIISIL